MKSSCNHFSKLFRYLGEVFVCILLLASCENFLKSNEVKNEIVDAIAYNNAVSCDISLKSDSQLGEFVQGSRITVKVGYESQIQFVVNKEDYYFTGFTAVCNTDQTISRSDFVELKCIEKDENKGLYTYSIKLITEAKDIAIRPVCLEYPKIISYSPASNKKDNQANTPIKLKFNIPFKDASVFNFDNISIEAFDEPAESLFELPVLSQDGLTLSIYPNAKLIVEKIADKKAAVMTVKLSFTDKIKIVKDEILLPLKQNDNSSFSVYYTPEIEEEAPEQKDFFITGNKTTISEAASVTAAEKFHDIDITDNYGLTTEQYRQKVMQNLVRNTVYIYGCFYDGDSGVKTVAVKEQTTNHQITGAAVVVDPTVTYYTAKSDGVEFVTEGGETKFCIKHTLTQDNGLVALDVSVLDACENPCNVKRHYAVKKDGFESQNMIFFEVCNDRQIAPGEINADEYHEKIKNITVYCNVWNNNNSYRCYYPPVLYKNIIFSQSDMELKCEYTDKNGIVKLEPLVPDTSNQIAYKWDIDLAQKIETVSGFEFKIILKDRLGNEAQHNYTIPDLKDFTVIVDPKEKKNSVSGVTTWTDENENLYKYELTDKINHSIIAHMQVKTDSDGIKTLVQPSYSTKPLVISPVSNSNTPSTIDTGYSYSIIPVNYFDDFSRLSNYGPYLIGEISDYSFSTEDYVSTSLNLDPVEVENVYALKTNEYDAVDIVVKLKSGTWESFDDVYISTSTVGLSFKFDNTKGEFIGRGIVYLVKKIQNYTRTFKVIGVKGVNTVESIDYSMSLYDANQIKEFDTDTPMFNSYYSMNSDDAKNIPREENYCVILCDDRTSELNTQKGSIYILDNNNMVLKSHKWTSLQSSTTHYFKIPVWELMPETGVFRNIKYELYDNAGNALINTVNCYNDLNKNINVWKFIEKTYGESNELKILGDYKGDSSYIEISKYNDSAEDKWETITMTIEFNSFTSQTDNWKPNSTTQTIQDPDLGEIYLLTYDLNNISYNNPYTSNYVTEPPNLNVSIDNSFLKLVKGTSSFCVTNTIYFYNGTPGSGDYDWFISNGESTDSMLVSSDAPVLIHTYITQLPYETCKDWSAQEWETYKQTCGEKCINFSSTDHAQRRYSIPVKNEIPAGSCYCAVAHFSDNHTEKSPVFVK